MTGAALASASLHGANRNGRHWEPRRNREAGPKPHAPLGFGRTRPSAARHSSSGTVRSFEPSAERVDRHIDIDPNKTGDEIRADMLRWLIERGIVIPEERRRSDWPHLAANLCQLKFQFLSEFLGGRK
jgi:hypothetical protein